ncbi:MAG TPA: ABC transporter permease [Solirubrobacteraceae bacterium]
MSSVGVSAELGRPIKGPSALGSDPRRFWHLTWTLAITEWKLRFFGSALGYLWSVFRPLMLFGVLYGVYSLVVGEDIVPYFPEAMLLGVVLFTYFSEATKGCVTSLIQREPLVRKIEFPRAAVPLSVVLTATFNLGLNLLPVFVFLLIDGGHVLWTWLELPVLIVALGFLATGVGMLLSAMFVRYRDIDPIWDVVLQVMFYASPIFYPIELLYQKDHGDLAQLLMVNPFAAVLQQARRAVFGPEHLSAAEAIGGWSHMVAPVAVAGLVVVVGGLVFSRRAPRIAEEL